MKVGDYVTVQQIMNQSAARWVVLSDMEFGAYYGVEGGIIRFIADTKAKADEKELELDRAGIDTYLVSGSWQTLVVDGVFVE